MAEHGGGPSTPLFRAAWAGASISLSRRSSSMRLHSRRRHAGGCRACAAEEGAQVRFNGTVRRLSLSFHCICTAFALMPFHRLCAAFVLPLRCVCTAFSLRFHCLVTALSLPCHCLFTAFSLHS